MKFRSTKVLSAVEAEPPNSQAVNLVIKEEEADKLKGIQEPQQSQESLPKSQRKSQKHPQESFQTSTYLGTDHLAPLLESLNNQLSVLEQFLGHAQLEKAHVPHLGSVMRNVKSLYRKNLRVVRVVGRLYSSQGWEWKYVHANNSALLRASLARGGYEGMANHPKVLAEMAGKLKQGGKYWQ